jgi:hypothetical protein
MIQIFGGWAASSELFRFSLRGIIFLMRASSHVAQWLFPWKDPMAADPVGPPKIGLDLEGPRITLDRLIQAVEAFLGILQDVDAQTTGRAGGSLDWVVEGMSGGSAHLEVVAQPRDELVPRGTGRVVVKNFARGMALIASRAEKPPFFTEAALRRARLLTTLAGQDGLNQLVVRVNGSRIAFTREVGKHVTELVDGTLRTIGSVEGTLDTVSLRGQSYFNVYDATTGRPIRCNFPRGMLDTVRDALGKRVLVEGVLYSRRTGEPTTLRAENLTVFPDESELPTVEMMRGVLSNG